MLVEAREVRARRCWPAMPWPYLVPAKDFEKGNSGKDRVLGAKVVTQLNSVRVSFASRKENGGSLAKAPAHAQAPPWATLRGPRRWLAFARCGSGPSRE